MTEHGFTRRDAAMAVQAVVIVFAFGALAGLVDGPWWAWLVLAAPCALLGGMGVAYLRSHAALRHVVGLREGYSEGCADGEKVGVLRGRREALVHVAEERKAQGAA